MADSYEKRIIRSLRQMTQYLDKHSRQLLKHQDITVPQVMCLNELMEKGALTVAVLAASIHLSPSTMVGIIDRLEKKKLVTRVRSNVDRRAVFIEVTEKGRKFITASPHLLYNKLNETLQRLSEENKIQVANALDLLILQMEKSTSFS